MKVVKVPKAKTTLSRLIEQALAGEEIIIAQGDTPVVRLAPLAAQPLGRVFGALKASSESPQPSSSRYRPTSWRTGTNTPPNGTSAVAPLPHASPPSYRPDAET